MNKLFVTGALTGVIVASAGGAMAGYQMVTAEHSAEVVSVKPLMKTVRLPRRACHDEQVTRTKPVKDQNRILGSGIGAVVGGLLGNQIGGGNGKALATVAGAVAGGYGGNRIQQKMQQGNTYTTAEQRCTTVYDISEKHNGYEVVYVLKGKRYHVHLNHDPGKTLPIRSGQVVLT